MRVMRGVRGMDGAVEEERGRGGRNGESEGVDEEWAEGGSMGGGVSVEVMMMMGAAISADHSRYYQDGLRQRLLCSPLCWR